MLMNLKSIFVLIFILFFRGINYAQYTPFFQNYTLTEFNAGNQNWGISLTNNGKLYVANDKGLLEFDGLKWNLFQLPNKTIIRSVFAINDIIYTGSYEDFGYWKKNQKGELVYTSLVNLKEQEISLDEEFWQIEHYKDWILFRSKKACRWLTKSFTNCYFCHILLQHSLDISFKIIFKSQCLNTNFQKGITAF